MTNETSSGSVPAAEQNDTVQLTSEHDLRLAALGSHKGRAALHLFYLCMASTIILMSMAFNVESEEKVTLPWSTIQLPPLCAMRQMAGWDCPGCGLTRCFVSLGHGDLQSALRFNAVGILIFAMVVFQVPYRITQLVRIKLGMPELGGAQWGAWFLCVATFLLIIQWIGLLIVGLGR